MIYVWVLSFLCAFYVLINTVISRNGMNKVFCILYNISCSNNNDTKQETRRGRGVERVTPKHTQTKASSTSQLNEGVKY